MSRAASKLRQPIRKRSSPDRAISFCRTSSAISAGVSVISFGNVAHDINLPLHGSKLSQKPHVVLVKQADVIDAVTQHGEAFNTEAEGPAGPNFRVVADIAEDFGMHHAAPGNFQPRLAELFHKGVAEVNFEARFGVAEVMGPETQPGFAAEQFLENKFYGALEV